MKKISHVPSAVPLNALPVLITLALWDKPLTPSQLLQFLNFASEPLQLEKKFDPSAIKAILSELTTLGLLAPSNRHDSRISDEVAHAILLYLRSTPQLFSWVEAVQNFLLQGKEYATWSSPSAAFCQREILFAGLTNNLAELGNWRSKFFSVNSDFDDLLAKKLFDTAAGMELFGQFEPNIQSILLFDLFSAANWSLKECTSAYQYAKTQVEALFSNDAMLINILCLQAILRGEIQYAQQELLRHLGSDSYSSAIMKLLAGDFYHSMEIFENVASAQQHSSQSKRLFIPDAAGLFYTVSLLASNTMPHLELALTQCDEGCQLSQAQFYPAIKPLIQHLVHGTPIQPQRHNPNFLDLDTFFIHLAIFWESGSPIESHRHQLYLLFAQCEQHDYHWLAAEIDQLRHYRFGETPELGDWHRENHLRPLCIALQKEDAWQRALHALSQLKTTATSEDNDTRVAWFLECDSFYINMEPREQKKSARGNWSKGRPIALRRLSYEQDSLPGISEQDKKIAGCVRKSFDSYHGASDYELNAEKALPLLVGHPAVFWLDAPEVQVEIIKGEPALIMKQQGETINLQLDPLMPTTNHAVVWRKQTPTRLAVFSSSPEIKQIASIIGKGLSVPADGKAQLVSAIAAIAPHLTIHSDLPELAQHMDSMAADSTIYAHLLPLKAGLRLQFLVRPLPEGGWFSPGKGPVNIVGEHQGKAMQASRDLAQEIARLDTLLKNCPTLNEAEQIGQEWEFHHPATCLELLSELNEFQSKSPEELKLIWPEGERFRIRAKRGSRQLRLSIKKQGDWFIAGGELELDDGQVIALRELIKLSNQAVGRFLQLDQHQFLALTDSFKKRLQELEALSEPSGKDAIRINYLAAPILAELASEVDDLKADAAWKAQVKKLDSLDEYVPQLPSTLQITLRDYQLEGYQWLSRLAHWGVGACLADDMGLGKTVQTIAVLVERAPSGPALVVAPISVVMNWQSEIAQFAPTLQVRAYHQQRSLANLGPFDLVLASYGMLQQDSDVFAQPHWHTVVLDEAQAIKNSATKRSQAAMQLKADFRIIASGTPVENHLNELWNLFRFINPGLLGSKEHFTDQFSNPIERGDKLARTHLKRLIQPFILRRTKTQVLHELPARTEIVWQVELSKQERHLYEALRQEALDNLDKLKPTENKSIQVLAEITKLRRFCCNPKLVIKNSELTGSKLAAFAEIVEELLDNNHKALVFSQFVDHLTIVRTWLDEKQIAYQYLDGSTAPAERKKRVDAFQAGQGDIFLISLKAGGTGLNLTAADYVIHLDPWWNPAVEDQASDRAHRMGQLRPVTIYRLVTQQTIEDQILALHSQKRDLADSLLEGGDASAKLDTAALLRLLKEGV